MDKGTKQHGAAMNEEGQLVWSEYELRLIEQGQQLIKLKMPQVYRSIMKKAESNARVWRLVRMGLAGRAGCFWAYEAGHTVGAPFPGLANAVQVSRLIARFGCDFVVMVAGDPEVMAGQAGGGHGAH